MGNGVGWARLGGAVVSDGGWGSWWRVAWRGGDLAGGWEKFSQVEKNEKVV